MKIESLHVDGFGLFHNLDLEVSPGLTVFCGPNESGKSTLLAFLRFMLFGFPPKRTKTNRYAPLTAGSPHGGTLRLCRGGHHYRLERHDKANLIRVDGTPAGEADLADLVSGVTRETFHSVFAFSLHELQQLGQAFDEASMRDALYGAIGGLDPQLLAGGEEYLEQESARLFKPRSKNATINAALAGLDDLQPQIRNAEGDLGAFEKLAAEVASLEGALDAARTRRSEIAGRLDLLKELAALLERRGKLAADIEQRVNEQAKLARCRAEIRPEAAVLSAARGIRELWSGRGQVLDLRRRKSDAEQNLGPLRQDLAAAQAALGAEWTPGRIANFQPPAGFGGQIEEHERKLHEAELRLAEARATERSAGADRDTAQEEERRAAVAWQSAPAPPPPPDPVLYEQLVSGRGDYDRATRDLRAREGELRSKEQEFRRSLAEIDARWTEEDLLRFDTSLPALRQIERFRDGLAEAGRVRDREREQLVRAEAEAAKAEQRRREAQEKHGAAPRAPGDDLGVLTGCRETLRRLALRYPADRHGRSRRLLAPAVAFAGVAAGVALALRTLSAGALVAAASALAGLWLWRLDRNRQAAWRALQADFAAVCAKLGFTYGLSEKGMVEAGRAIDAAIEAARERQALFDRLQQAREDENEARQRRDRGREALGRAEAALRQWAEDWRRHVETLGLAGSLLPEGTLAIVPRVEVSRGLRDGVLSLRHRIEAMERNRQEHLGVLIALLAARGEPQASHADLSVRRSQFLETINQENELRRRKEKAHEEFMRALENRRRAEDVWLHASGRHQQAAERQQEAAAAWRAWLSGHALSPHLSPASVRDLVQAIGRARELQSRVGEIEQQLRDIADRERDFAAREGELLAACGRAASGDAVTDLDHLAAALESAEEASRQAAVLEARLGEMGRQIEGLRQEVRQLDQDMERLGSVGAKVEIEAHRQALAQKLEEVDAQMQGIQERLLECRRSRQAMATDERLSQLYEQKQARLEQISQAARQWAVLALARRMFEEARRRYEEQRQPAVLRRASEHLRRLTGDRYREVRMPLGGADLHVLPAGDGPPKAVDQLSRGTAEQLYLALRFGFIEEFAGSRDLLPIVMDDILVNFDPSRAKAAVETLIRLAENFQILYFTCHPGTAETFREMDSGIPVLQFREGQFAVEQGVARSAGGSRQ